MSAHRWANTGIVNNGGVLRMEDKYCIFRCVGCGQELWHYYDLVPSPLCAAEAERIPPVCQPGKTQLVTHRQVEMFLERATVADLD